MVPQFIIFLLGFVLAGSTPLEAIFQRSIETANINELNNLINANRNFLRDPISETSRNAGFLLAVQRGHSSVVDLFLRRINFNAGLHENVAIKMAARNGHSDIVRMLLPRPDVDPSAANNYALKIAILSGHNDIVRALLSRPEVDPTAIGNNAIRSAAENGNSDIVEMLQQDDRVISIQFLQTNPAHLTITSFLNLFKKYGSSSYIESVFAERENDGVASFISDLLEIPLTQAKSIHNLDDFDNAIDAMFDEINRNPHTFLNDHKIAFLLRYYGATKGYKDHFHRFQEMTIYFSQKRH